MPTTTILSPFMSTVKSIALLITLMYSHSIVAQTADITIGGMVVDRSIVTVRNNNLVFNGLTEFQVESGYSIIGVTESADKGKVELLNNFQLAYEPSPNTCNKRDEFSYLISDGASESIQEIVVEILCESLAILSSMSPDGDGTQDSFVILGLDGYPDNELVIFNDLGLEIFRQKQYQNDWDGTFQGNKLPTGVYYYVFEPGNGEKLSGYLCMGDAM